MRRYGQYTLRWRQFSQNGLGLGMGLTQRNPATGAPIPPPGYLFLVDSDGAYLLDSDGVYLVEAS